MMAKHFSTLPIFKSMAILIFKPNNYILTELITFSALYHQAWQIHYIYNTINKALCPLHQFYTDSVLFLRYGPIFTNILKLKLLLKLTHKLIFYEFILKLKLFTI